MNRRLIDYNPEGQGAEGEVLLFGMPPPPSRAASSEVDELEFASAFLDAGKPRRAEGAGEPVDAICKPQDRPSFHPDVARALAPRLVRAGAIISASCPRGRSFRQAAVPSWRPRQLSASSGPSSKA